MTEQRDFVNVIKVIDLKIGSLCWIFEVGPIQPYQPLKAENFL